MATLYAKLDAPLIRTDLQTAEMVKYVDNCWHALKIGFANEIGNICKALSIDAHEVMKIFCQDKKLNISSAYLLPGFAFGGSCLPKDLRALSYKAKMHDLDLPIMTSILPSNELQVARGLQLIMEKGDKRVGVLGFQFQGRHRRSARKPDDRSDRASDWQGIRPANLRQEREYRKPGWREPGFHPESYSAYFPANGERNRRGSGRTAQTVVIGNKDPDFTGVQKRMRPGQRLVDFVRITNDRSENGKYDGICW